MRRHLLHQRSFVAISALVLGCGGPAPSTPAHAVVVDVANAGPSAGAVVDVAALTEAARAALLPYGRTLVSAPPPIFYTWTTEEQITELARDRVLLTRERSPQNGPSFFEREMDWSASSDPIAALLRTAAFARMRFAWSAPWATVSGWEGESYGTQLIGVTLKPEAWIAVYTTSKRSSDAVDLQGHPIAVKDALKHPERLGAVLFVHDSEGPEAFAGGRAGYREYVLCNESMIAKFSVGTDDEKRAVSASLATVKAFSAFVDASPRRQPNVDTWNTRVRTASWRRLDPKTEIDPYVLFEESLAIPSSEYLPERGIIHRLVATLEDLPAPIAQFTHLPKAKFQPTDAVIKRPAPPPPAPTSRPQLGTY